MNRLKKYKQMRNVRQKYLFLVFLLILILIAGICTVDYSVNNLMGKVSKLFGV